MSSNISQVYIDMQVDRIRTGIRESGSFRMLATDVVDRIVGENPGGINGFCRKLGIKFELEPNMDYIVFYPKNAGISRN